MRTINPQKKVFLQPVKTKTMNLLIITPYIPYPLHSGGNRVQFNMIDGLRKHIDISLLLPVRSTADRRNVDRLKSRWPDVSFYLYDDATPASKPSRYHQLLLSLRASIDRKINRLLRKEKAGDPVRAHASLSAGCCRPHDESFVNFVYRTAAKGFDIVQIEFVEWLDLVYALPQDAMKVFLHHEIRFVRQEIELSLLQHITPADRYLYRYARDHEIGCLRAFDHVLVFSDTDRRKLLAQLPDISIFTSPSAGLEDDSAPATGEVCEDCRQVVFLGGASHFPNKDGLEWFLEHCWNHILSRKPGVELHVVGEWRSSLIERYTSSYRSVGFTGFVASLAEVLRNKIMNVPIRIGSGMRIKILDGVMNACPLVTTTVGVEGIDLADGEDCLIADDPAAFAEAVIYLLEHPEICRKLTAKALQKMNGYTAAKQLERRLNVYRQITNTVAEKR
jgi:glycosyltransferase involved in cell wall biosynthesis